MRFASVQYIYFAVPFAGILLLFLMWAERDYRRQSAVFAKPRALKLMNPYLDFRHPWLHIILAAVSVLLIGVALSRPQWGFYWSGDRDKGRDIIFALDLSKSMASQDSVPDRLTRAKSDIAAFAARSEDDRLALVGFSGDAFLFCPLTVNRDTFIRSLNAAEIGSVKRGGTSYFNLMLEAARSFKATAARGRILVILSDGEDTEGSLDKAVELAKKENIKIFSVGVGTAAGGTIPVTGNDGKTAVVKDDKGAVVRTRLDETALKRLAAETGGLYEHDIGAADVLEKIRTVLNANSNDGDVDVPFGRTYKERFQIPLLMAFLLLAADLLIGTVTKSEKR